MVGRFQFVIFDFDGTLADSFPWFRAELNGVARHWGFRTLAAGEEEALRMMSAAAIFRHLGVPRWKIPWIARDLRTRMARDIDRIQVFDGVTPMLEALARARLRLAVVSSNAAENVEQVLGPTLPRYISAIECGVSLAGKHARLKRLRRRFGVSATSMLYIGDEVRDLDAARRARIAAGAVTWGYNRKSALLASRPDLLFERFSEIPQRILGSAYGCPLRCTCT